MTRHTRRNVLVCGAAAIATGSAAACAWRPPGKPGDAPVGRAQPPGPPVTLEFWGGPNSAQRQDQVTAWNAKHPDVQVTFRPAPAAGQGAAALRTFVAAVAAHTAPQILDFDRFQVATYVNWRVFHPLDDLAARDKYDVTRFLPVALEEATGFDRKLYGLPNSVDDRLLYWHKESFAEAGLDPEQPPATWDDLREFAVRLTRRDGRSGLARLGFHTEEGQASLHLFAWQNGGGFQSPDGKTATLPLLPNQEALQWLVDLAQAQGGWPAMAAFRQTWGPDAQQAFLTGRLAMQYDLPNWAGDVLGKYRPDLAFGVAPPPAKRSGDPPLTWSGGYSYVMSRDANDRDAAWDVLKWLVGEEAWAVAGDGESARAQAAGGLYVPGMTGQPALDERLPAKYKTGRPAIDRVMAIALGLMRSTRLRERSIAATDLWDGVLRAQAEATALAKPARQALEEQNALVQRALDQAWIFVPQ